MRHLSLAALSGVSRETPARPEQVDTHEEALERALDELERAAEQVGHLLGAHAREQLRRWTALVIEWRSRAQLTGSVSADRVVAELMTPAVFALGVCEVGDATTTLDLGCGNGCTGAALAAAAGTGRWVLVDRARKKVSFCRYALTQCRIPGVEAATREEWVGQSVPADVILARALPGGVRVQEDLERFARPGATVVRWVKAEPQARHVGVARCGSAHLWVVADPVERFT